MRTAVRTGLVLPAVLGIATGCFSLARESPALEQYVLGRAVPTAPVQERATQLTGLDIGMRRIDLALYLATPAIIVRQGSHQIVQSDFHRWGEELGESINRTVASYVATGTTVRTVDIAPWPIRARYDYVVQLRISAFEGIVPDAAAATGDALMVASWEISRQLDGVQLARGLTDYRATGWRTGDYAGLVSLLDTGLEQLASDLQRCLALLAVQAARAVGSEPANEAVLACPSGAVQ